KAKLLKESPHGDAETRQDVREDQVVVWPENLRRLVGVMHFSCLSLNIKHANRDDAGGQVFRYLRPGPFPGVSWGAHLESQFGNYTQIPFRPRAFGYPSVTVKCHVGPADRVWVAFGDNARIVAHYPPQILIFQEAAKVVDGFRANVPVA